jgi:hypothetical protein
MKNDEKDNAMTPEEIQSLALPSEFDEASYQAAMDLSDLFRKGQFADEPSRLQVMKHYHDKLMNHLNSFTRIRLFPKWGWPSSLYIPAQADWQNYWMMAPPTGNRYARDWATAPGYSWASRASGEIHTFERIRTIDRKVKSDAGVGILFTPTRTLSVVSLQPQVICSGHYQYHQDLKTENNEMLLTKGYTQVKTELHLGAWQAIPGPSWDLIHMKPFTIYESARESGSFSGPPSPYTRSFTGLDLATPFLVEGGRTYLLGIVASVSGVSTLTDIYDAPLPLITDDTFSVWGSLVCKVPQIELLEQQVHIP